MEMKGIACNYEFWQYIIFLLIHIFVAHLFILPWVKTEHDKLLYNNHRHRFLDWQLCAPSYLNNDPLLQPSLAQLVGFTRLVKILFE